MIKNRFSELTGARVLVIANVTVDEIYAVAALPETGESLIGQFRLRDVGGKGANVATLFSRCGLSTRLVAATGNDSRGRFVRDRLSQEPMDVDLLVNPDIPTDISLIYTDACGDNSIVSTVDAAHSLHLTQLRAAFENLLPQDLLVLQGNLSEALTLDVVNYAKEQGVMIVLNPSPFASWLEKIVTVSDILFVNAGEAHSLTGQEDEAAVHTLLEKGPSQVVLTRGADGALLGTHRKCSDTGTDVVVNAAAALTTAVVDTTGAGDTYLAVALASARLRGSMIDVTALTHAARAAAITISTVGTHRAFPDATMLARILADTTPIDTATDIDITEA